MFQVYDNGGKTVDRYTIYLLEAGELVGCITTNGDPNAFWQHTECDPTVIGVNEKRMSVMDLPAKARKQLLLELEEVESA